VPVGRTITVSQRFGVWKAADGRCYWCREPIVFKNCHIDHILPLRAVELLGGMEAVRRRYSLPADFKLDSFENWIAACPGCNQSKGQTLIDPSPEFQLAFMGARAHGPVARAISETIDLDSRKAPLLAKLERAVSAGDIQRKDLEDFLSGLPELVRKGVALTQVLHIAPGWELIIEGSGDRRLIRI